MQLPLKSCCYVYMLLQLSKNLNTSYFFLQINSDPILDYKFLLCVIPRYIAKLHLRQTFKKKYYKEEINTKKVTLFIRNVENAKLSLRIKF